MNLETIQRDIADLSAAVTEGMGRIQYGSYSERTPHLGKMKTCPFCHKRKREFDVENVCCNASHATSQRAWDAERGFYQESCSPRIAESNLKKLVKKMQHKKHSNKKRNQIHDLTLLFQGDSKILEHAVRDMCGALKSSGVVDLPGPTAIPAFAEKYWGWTQARKAKALRKMQKKSRRINN